MKYIKILLVFILFLSFQETEAQVNIVDPREFTEETSPDETNFEVYSRKLGVNRRARLDVLKEYFNDGNRVILSDGPPMGVPLGPIAIDTTVNVLDVIYVDMMGIWMPINIGGTDDQNLVFNPVTNELTIESGNTVDLSTLQDGTGTDDQTLTLSGTDLTIEDGNTVDLSNLNTGTDDQTLSISGTDLTIEDGNTVDLSGIDTDTDDQTLILSGTDLSISEGNTVDLSGINTDDQTLSLSGTDLSIESGNTVDLSGLQDGTGTDDQNLSNGGKSGNDQTINIENGTGVTFDVSDLDNDPNNEIDITTGTIDPIAPPVGNEPKVYQNTTTGDIFTHNGVVWQKIEGTDDQTLSISGTQLTIEDGNTVDLVTIQDGTGTDDQILTLSGNDLTIEDGNTISLTNTGTDDQALTLSGTDLTIEDGNTVDLSGLQDGTGTDDQTLTFNNSNNELTIESGNTVDLSSLAGGGGTDDQTLTLSGTDLTIEDGNTVDLSGLQDGTGTDDQNLTLTGNNLTIESGNTVDLSGIDTDTDDQTLTLSGTDLTIESGNTVDLSGIDTDTDDQTLTYNATTDVITISEGNSIDITEVNTDDQTLSLSGTDLSIQDGNTVDLSGLQDGTGTDDQNLTLSGTDLTIEDGNTVDLSGLQDGTGTDDQNLTFNSSNNELTIESGNTVDLSSLAGGGGTDDQNLTLSGTDLTIEDGNTVDLSAIDTDDQTLTLSGTDLSIEDGNTVDLSGLQDGTGTDDQTLTLSGTDLTIESGNTVDLSGIDTDTDTDDQTLSYNATTDVITISEGNSIDITEVNTDDQALTLSGTDLSIESGNTVDLSGLQDGTGTDDQNLTLSGTDLTIESGNTVDLSGLQDGTGTDDQNLTLSGTDLTIEDGNTVDLSGVDTDTDDQTLSLSGTDLSIQDGNTVDLSGIQDGTGTDDQNLTLSGNNLTIEAGNTVDLSVIDTDDQTLTFSGTDLSIQDGNTVDLSGLQDGTGTDDQTLTLTGNNLSIESGNTVDLSVIDTDDQTLTYNATTDVITISEGNSIDITEVNTDDQTLTFSGTDLTIESGNTVDLSGLQDGTGTDDQTLIFNATNGNLTIESGNTVDISDLDNISVNDQTNGLDISNVANTIEISPDFLELGYLSSPDPTDRVMVRGGASGNHLYMQVQDFQDGTGTDDQTLTYNNDTQITIEDGNTIDIFEEHSNTYYIDENATGSGLQGYPGHPFVHPLSDRSNWAAGDAFKINKGDYDFTPFIDATNNENHMLGSISGTTAYNFEPGTNLSCNNCIGGFIGDDSGAFASNVTISGKPNLEIESNSIVVGGVSFLNPNSKFTGDFGTISLDNVILIPAAGEVYFKADAIINTSYSQSLSAGLNQEVNNNNAYHEYHIGKFHSTNNTVPNGAAMLRLQVGQKNVASTKNNTFIVHIDDMKLYSDEANRAISMPLQKNVTIDSLYSKIHIENLDINSSHIPTSNAWQTSSTTPQGTFDFIAGTTPPTINNSYIEISYGDGDSPDSFFSSNGVGAGQAVTLNNTIVKLKARNLRCVNEIVARISNWVVNEGSKIIIDCEYCVADEEQAVAIGSDVTLNGNGEIVITGTFEVKTAGLSVIMSTVDFTLKDAILINDGTTAPVGTNGTITVTAVNSKTNSTGTDANVTFVGLTDLEPAAGPAALEYAYINKRGSTSTTIIQTFGNLTAASSWETTIPNSAHKLPLSTGTQTLSNGVIIINNQLRTGSPGLYEITATAVCNEASADDYFMGLYKNNATFEYGVSPNASATTDQITFTLTWVGNLSNAEFIDFRFGANTGGTSIQIRQFDVYVKKISD